MLFNTLVLMKKKFLMKRKMSIINDILLCKFSSGSIDCKYKIHTCWCVCRGLRLCYGVKCHFQQHFSYIVAVSFIGGETWSTQRKPLTCRKSLTDFIT